MSNVNYVKGDLFELAPEDAYLAHACNCQGVWGSGIAVEFRKRFKLEYEQYVSTCNFYGRMTLGHADLFGRVVCLYTSYDYGVNKDSPETIINSTRLSLINMTNELEQIKELHMPKINSGLFAVPWEETEKILLEFPEITFYVYELD